MTEYPDGVRGFQAYKAVLREGQLRFNVAFDQDFASGDSGIVPIYLVPEDYQLNITYWKSSMERSGIFYAHFYADVALLAGIYIDLNAFGYTGDTGAYVVEAGETFGISVYNPHAVAVHGKGRLGGTLTQI